MQSIWIGAPPPLCIAYVPQSSDKLLIIGSKVADPMRTVGLPLPYSGAASSKKMKIWLWNTVVLMKCVAKVLIYHLPMSWYFAIKCLWGFRTNQPALLWAHSLQTMVLLPAMKIWLWNTDETCLQGPNLSSIQRSTMILKFEQQQVPWGPWRLNNLICFQVVENYVTVFAAMLQKESHASKWAELRRRMSGWVSIHCLSYQTCR